LRTLARGREIVYRGRKGKGFAVAEGRKRGIDTSGIDDIIGYRLRRAQMAVFSSFLKHFHSAGLKPAEYSVLILAADNPGLKPSQMAAALGMQRANFVALAAGLEERRLIERKVAENDRRSHGLFLTAVGVDTVNMIRAVQEKFEAELVAQLGGEAERRHLIALLKKLG
jgi:DNA-binding MarR family transcriptional regulator